MMNPLVISALNLGILVTFLFVKLRTPIKGFVSQRHDQLRNELEEVRNRLAAAQKSYEDYAAKLKAVQTEVRMMQDEARSSALAASKELIMRSEGASKQIVENAQRMKSGFYDDLKSNLRKDLSDTIIAQAESRLRSKLTGDDRARLRKQFSAQLGGSQ